MDINVDRGAAERGEKSLGAGLQPRARPWPLALLLAAACLPGLACGDSGEESTDSATAGETSEGDPGPISVPENEAARALAAAYCESLFDCECGETNYDDYDACFEAVAVDYAVSLNAGPYDGLSYQSACVGAELERYQDFACDSYAALDESGKLPSGCEAPCPYYAGSKQLGEACAIGPSSQWSDCAAGLICSDGACAEFCAGEGDDCAAGSGVACSEGLVCDVLGSETCAPLPGEGEPCVSEICGPALYCSSDDACTPRRGQGENCLYDDMCGAGLYCDAYYFECLVLPAEGEDCSDGVCEAGLSCEPQLEVCVPLEAWVCELPQG